MGSNENALRGPRLAFFGPVESVEETDFSRTLYEISSGCFIQKSVQKKQGEDRGELAVKVSMTTRMPFAVQYDHDRHHQ